MRTQDWDEKSQEVQSLIRGMLQVDEEQRWTAFQVINSDWFLMQEETVKRDDCLQ